jgi:hypothetical protein
MDLDMVRVVSFLLFLSNYEHEDVYYMNETGVYLRANPNKTLSQGKVKGQKLHKERGTLALVMNLAGTHMLKLFVIYMSKQP